MRKSWLYIIAAFFLAIIALSVISANEAGNVMPEAETETIEPEAITEITGLEVHFIDVGQGDATLIKADGHYMLIDAGDNTKGTAVQFYLQQQGVDKLDYLILTHTDADHIGGADVIVTKFDIDEVFLGGDKKDNETYEDLESALSYRGLKYTTPEQGNEYTLGSATFTILSLNKAYDNANDNSIALLLKHGDNTFLFTGDCEEEAEADILASGIDVDCDVYKVGHHGSKTSSSKTFLEAITPTYGVISCAENNDYGHPHAETLNNLRDMGVQVFRTDEQGSIVVYSDGTEITWNCAPSETWQVGEVIAKETVSVPSPEASETYAVNGKNGKIHIVGACPATGAGKDAMKSPIYFDAYEEAERHSVSIAPQLTKRQCGNCW